MMHPNTIPHRYVKWIGLYFIDSYNTVIFKPPNTLFNVYEFSITPIIVNRKSEDNLKYEK